MDRRTSSPLVSIITVCYNAGDLLLETIESVLSQTYPHIEYIIIDGASTDHSLQIIKKHQDHISYWSSEADEGIYHAMNKGIQQATGDWINFMNVGDVFYNENALANIMAEANEQTGLLYSDAYIKQENGELKLRQHKPLFQYGLYNNICHQATFYHIKKIGKFQYNTKYQVSADFQVLLDLIEAKNTYYQQIKQPLVIYRSGGFSDQKAYLALKEREEQFKNIRNPLIKKLNQRNLCRQQTKLSRQLKKTGQPLALILSLGRFGGCVHYATEIIDELDIAHDTYTSAFTQEKAPKFSRQVWTYKNRFQFVLSSLFILPLFWLKIVWASLRKPYTVIYFPYKHFWNLPFLCWFKLLGRKTVMTIHDGILHDGEQNKLEQWLVRQCIKRADELIFLTQFVKEQTQKNIGFTAPAQLIEHGMFATSLQTKPRKHKPKPRLLFLGRIGKYKGVDLLIEAVRQLPEDSYTDCRIAGTLMYNLQYQAHPKIYLINKWLSDEEIADLLGTSDILVLPYKEASQSGVIVLGIAAAIPMICTQVGGLTEQLRQDEALFITPEIKALQQAILQLTQDRSLYEDMSQQLLQKQKNLSWINIAKRVEQVLKAD